MNPMPAATQSACTLIVSSFFVEFERLLLAGKAERYAVTSLPQTRYWYLAESANSQVHIMPWRSLRVTPKTMTWSREVFRVYLHVSVIGCRGDSAIPIERTLLRHSNRRLRTRDRSEKVHDTRRSPFSGDGSVVPSLAVGGFFSKT
jgi:hypothetical protein